MAKKLLTTYARAAALLGKKSRGAKVATGYTVVPANPERTAIDLYPAYRIKDIYEGNNRYHYKPDLRIFPDDTYVFPQHKGSDASLAQFSAVLPFTVQGIQGQMTVLAYSSRTVSYRGLAVRDRKILTPIVPHVRRASELKKEYDAARRKLKDFVEFTKAMRAWEDPLLKDAQDGSLELMPWIKPYDLGMMSRYINNDKVFPHYKKLMAYFCTAFRSGEYDNACLKMLVQSSPDASKAVDYFAAIMGWEMGYFLTPSQWLSREHPDFNGDQWWEQGRQA